MRKLKRLSQGKAGLAAANELRIQAEEQAVGDNRYWPIYNLDHKNPKSAEALEYLPPEELVESILAKEREILRLMEEVKVEVSILSTEGKEGN